MAGTRSQDTGLATACVAESKIKKLKESQDGRSQDCRTGCRIIVETRCTASLLRLRDCPAEHKCQ